MSAENPTRHGFVVNVRPEQRERYLELHREVWPGVLAKITEGGIRNYSIFILENTLFAYYEYVGDDFEASMALIAADPETREWWSNTDPCQIAFGTAPDGTLWREMESAFYTA